VDDFNLLTAEQEMIIDLSCDPTLKQMFQQGNNIVTFWLGVKKDYQVLTKKALGILLPFVITYVKNGVFCSCCFEDEASITFSD
jgi:hypothetical protein